MERFQLLEEIIDLEKALQHQYQVLALTPNDHPHLPHQLHNLGVFHFRRFGRLRSHDDLAKAIEYITRALELTPHGHPTMPGKHLSLAAYRLSQYRHTSDESDLQDSLASFRVASQSLVGSPRVRFKNATNWARMACHETFLDPIEAYQTAINLLPQFIWLGATTSQRYQDLSTTQSLAVDAALAAILTSDCTLAIEWLEHARCVVWNQTVTLRSPFNQLHSVHPELATSLQNVAHRLHTASSDSQESRVLASSTTLEQVAQEHRQLAREYENLIAQARTLPGFQDFLQPIKANDLVRAARYGPVVIINCHDDRCNALAITPVGNHVQHIALPNFTGKNAQSTRQQMEQSVRNSRMTERTIERRPVLEDRVEFETVLAVLWYDVVKPVLDHLGYTDNIPSDNLPHVTWCPTGALSFLPLHAAGDYTQPKSRVFDYVISSYTPTLSALLSTSPSPLTPDTKVLAVGQANTPGHSPLPGTTAELAYLKNHTSGRAGYSELTDRQAKNAVVLDEMERHDWVHLACHAHQSVEDPTKSGFFLHDKDPLDLASINRRSFKNKGLAYLSACQTATGDKSLPNEAIHLASGMLMAGYSSVIGTMWSVMDDDAPFVANRVYGELMREGKIGNGEAGKALHNAVAALRERVGETSFNRWVPYIHVGS
ncbi:hypothetical protein OPQ81_002654 [Rhizoctonia solani]|nr:hypothetical protein OPQ81_002654 [Rhizoctonia solani]